MDPVRSHFGVVLAVTGFFGCGESRIVFGADSRTTSSGISGLGGAAGAGGSASGTDDAGPFGGSAGVDQRDAAADRDAATLSCPDGMAPVYAADTTADALASTATHLYWLDAQQKVMRQSKATGEREKLTDTSARGSRIRIDDTRVFWEEFGANAYRDLYSMPLDASGGPVRLATRILGWTVGVDRVFYWKPDPAVNSGSGIGEIDSVAKDSDLSTVVVAQTRGGLMATDDQAIYWYDGMLQKFTFASSAQTLFNEATYVRHLLADGRHVLWATVNGNEVPNDIRWSSPSGAPVLTIASGQDYIVGLVADATTAYWTNGPAGPIGSTDLVAAPLDGGPLRKLACDIEMPVDMAVDDEAVYISTLRPTIFRIAKN